VTTARATAWRGTALISGILGAFKAGRDLSSREDGAVEVLRWGTAGRQPREKSMCQVIEPDLCRRLVPSWEEKRELPKVGLGGALLRVLVGQTDAGRGNRAVASVCQSIFRLSAAGESSGVGRYLPTSCSSPPLLNLIPTYLT